MRLASLFVPVMLSGLTTATCAGPSAKITAHLNSPTIFAGGGQVYLQLSVHVPAVSTHDRRPMNLSVVLDRSGSMADQGKLEYAKQALCTLIDQLKEQDIFSIVMYDDIIDVLRPAGRVGDKERIKRLVRSIEPRNSTNLGGGMLEGYQQVERNLHREYVNRVVLLSDGLANVGITDDRELSRIARRYRNRGISLTSMGVGLDYNENLMVALSESGGGNYYFIESPHGLAHIMRREFDMLSTIYARHASVQIHLGANVRVSDVIGHEWNGNEGTCTIELGDLYGGDNREITIEMEVPRGKGSLQVAEGILQHKKDASRSERLASFTASATYTADKGEVDKRRDMDVQAKADVALSTRAVDRATQALDEGKDEEARAILGAAEVRLNESAAAPCAGAAGAAVREQSQRLQEYKVMLEQETDGRRAKKEIQYRNYQTQKKK